MKNISKLKGCINMLMRQQLQAGRMTDKGHWRTTEGRAVAWVGVVARDLF